jgi:hypothetical protein
MDPERVRKKLDLREQEAAERNLQLWKKAKADADRILEMLVTVYHPKRVWQWGSVIEPEMFRKGSDIDFALEGIPDAPTWFRLLGDAMDMTDFSLDLVELDKIAPEFADIIRMKGRVVYEC